MRLPVRIEGYAGEHDEAGARIVDADGRPVCTTPHLKANTPEDWAEYNAHNASVVNLINFVERIPASVSIAYMGLLYE